MYNAQKGDAVIRGQVLTKCWQYLLDNFQKFSEGNKIKIALELSKKSIPNQTQIEGELTVVHMPSIVVKRETGNRLLEFNLG